MPCILQGLKQKKILSLNFFLGAGGSTCKACNDSGNFNIWKDTMEKLLLSLFKQIFQISMTKYLSFNYKKLNNAVAFWNILTNLGL